jgi:ABC-2 type transport system permease protein
MSHARLWLPGLSLCQREIVRFVRQRSRVIGALATPIVFWLLIGGGMGRSFHAPHLPGGEHFIAFFFPGTLVMILLFSAIFSTISIIEDRREGFLQAVLVAPVSPRAITLGKVLGGTLLAWGQGLLFLLLAPTVGIRLTLASFMLCVAIMLVLSLALTALGVCIAWRMTSTQGFHAIMNLFLLPMWFLSGALFPPDNAAAAIRWVMWANPLTWGLGILRRAMYLGTAQEPAWPSWGLGVGVTLLFAAAMFLLAERIVSREREV